MVWNPDPVFSGLSRQVKEVGPDGEEVTKLVPPSHNREEMKEVLIKNNKRRITPQPLKIRADIDMKCFQFDIERLPWWCHFFFSLPACHRFSLFPWDAMRKAEAAGNEDCPVKIKLVAPPPLPHTLCSCHADPGQETIEQHKGKLTVKEAPRAVSEREDKLLAEHMAKLRNENEEVSGDGGSDEEEEDTGLGDADMENTGIMNSMETTYRVIGASKLSGDNAFGFVWILKFVLGVM